METPRISLCLIVKNEEHCLARCLESVKPILYEIIAVDTGSSDSTKTILESFGAQITEIEWQGDFSLARNISLSKASGDWILVLDADEVIAARDLRALKALASEVNTCYEFLQRHYSSNYRLSGYQPCRGEFPELEQGQIGFFESNLVRLFPNHRGVSYRNRIHELVEHSIYEIPDLKIVRSEIRIHHYGHTDEALRRKRKAKFYQTLGKEKVADRPNDWKAQYELGIELLQSGDLEESAVYLIKAGELYPAYTRIWTNLGHVLTELERYQDAKAALEYALKLDPNSEDACCNLGVVYIRTNNFKPAVTHLERAIQINPKYVNAYLNLGLALGQLNLLPAAERAYRRAIEVNGFCPAAKCELGAVLMAKGELAEAEKLLKEALKEDPTVHTAHFFMSELKKAQGYNYEAAAALRTFIAIEEQAGPVSETRKKLIEKAKESLAIR